MENNSNPEAKILNMFYFMKIEQVSEIWDLKMTIFVKVSRDRLACPLTNDLWMYDL